MSTNRSHSRKNRLHAPCATETVPFRHSEGSPIKMKRVQLLVLLLIALLMLPAIAGAQGLKSSGIISSSRATDWTQAGAVPGSTGSLPDTSWAQCGSTVSAGTSAATITSDLAACPANTYLMLGPGTFNLSGQIRFPTTGHVVLRGSGAKQHFSCYRWIGWHRLSKRNCRYLRRAATSYISSMNRCPTCAPGQPVIRKGQPLSLYRLQAETAPQRLIRQSRQFCGWNSAKPV